MIGSDYVLHAPRKSPKPSLKVILAAGAAVGCIILLIGVAYGTTQASQPDLGSFAIATKAMVLRCPSTCGMGFRRDISQITPSRNLRLRGGAMTEIAKGVSFDTVAREWRMKWTAESDKASLVAAQEALDEVLSEVKAVPGVKSVQRVVCGGCLDFKVVTALEAEKFGDWEGSDFAPETKFLEKVKAIPGISFVETQTYTLMPM
ncbi:hypothetical protein AAMO2058_001469900 [Amorphochlora amoebiformis]